MARCTRSITRNAWSIAAPARRPCALISTSVPRSGRARLAVAQLAFIQGQDALHAVGDVAAGKRRAADIADVAVELQRIPRRLAGELQPPLWIADFAAVRFAVVADLHAA